MLPAPRQVVLNPAYTPLLRVCESVLLTAQEVAKHTRYNLQSIHNMRSRGRGPAWLKFGDGAVRYRMSEFLSWEITAHRGPLTLERVSLALSTVPGMCPKMREKIEAHLASVLEAS